MSSRVVMTTAAVLLAIVAAAVSRETTLVRWNSMIPEGESRVRVQSRRGVSLPHAYLSLMSEEGKPLSYGRDGSGDGKGLFSNYTVPGSVRADSNGVLRLQNSYKGYGGSEWKLFWLWKIRKSSDMSLLSFVIAVSAPGYETGILTLDDIMSQNEITITLDRAVVPVVPAENPIPGDRTGDSKSDRVDETD